MKEHPLLFTSNMVKAVLAGRKTQTRRIGKRYDSWKVGDLIWARETWCVGVEWDDEKPSEIDLLGVGGIGDIHYFADGARPCDGWGKTRPSIFMPRWASRITLKITGLRDERLHRITAADVKAEGVPESAIEHWRKWLHPADCAAHAFGVLWNKINGKKPGRAWKDNPIVKVIEFEVT